VDSQGVSVSAYCCKFFSELYGIADGVACPSFERSLKKAFQFRYRKMCQESLSCARGVGRTMIADVRGNSNRLSTIHNIQIHNATLGIDREIACLPTFVN